MLNGCESDVRSTLNIQHSAFNIASRPRRPFPTSRINERSDYNTSPRPPPAPVPRQAQDAHRFGILTSSHQSKDDRRILSGYGRGKRSQSERGSAAVAAG